MSRLRPIHILLALFVFLAGLYSVLNPIFEAPDELFHYPMVEHIARGEGLPVLDEESATTRYRQEGGQPPLYYLLGAALIAPLDTRDVPEIYRLNPHADPGRIAPDGNPNMMLHFQDGREDFPWTGTVLAVHLLRFFSITLAGGTVYGTYRLARAWLPGREKVALLAAGLVAFNPMFLFISSSVNNDNLSTLLATLLLLQISALLLREGPARWRDYVLLGITAGAGMLAKFQLGFMLPVIGLVLAWKSWKERDWRPLIVGGAVAGGLTIALAGWWYLRNYDLYGDPTGIEAFLDVVGRRQVTPTAEQLWSERNSFARTFWGLFGWISVPLQQDWFYGVFNGLALVGAMGWLLGALDGWRRGLRWDGRQAARLLGMVWPLVVFAALIRWTTLTPASQGRLLFAALAPLMIGMAAGYSWLAGRLRCRLLILLPLAWFSLMATVYSPLALIEAYNLPPQLDNPPAAWPLAFAEPGEEEVALQAAAHPLPEAVRPGDYLALTVDMQAAAAMSRNWSLFVHLVSDVGIIEAQRDVYPGGGLIPTAEIEAGRTWRNPIAVEIPPGTYAPQTLRVYLGIYDYPTGERMQVLEPAGLDTERILLGTVELRAADGGVPNPVEANFDNRLTLQGYALDRRRLREGDTLAVELFWRVSGDMTQDWVASVQVIDPATAHKAAQDDRFPGDQPSSQRPPGQTFQETRQLTILPDTPPGVYRIMVRLYRQRADGDFQTLPVMGGVGAQAQDFVYLGWVRVE